MPLLQPRIPLIALRDCRTGDITGSNAQPRIQHRSARPGARFAHCSYARMGPPEHPKSPAWSPKSLFSMSSLAPRTNNSLERVSKMLFSNSSTPSSSRFFRASASEPPSCCCGLYAHTRMALLCFFLSLRTKCLNCLKSEIASATAPQLQHWALGQSRQ
jgi:hypothetical protein